MKFPCWTNAVLSLLISGMLCAELAGAPANVGSQQTYLECLLDFERYADANWHPAIYSNAPADAGYFGDGASDGNGGLRANCGTAVAYAVLARAFPEAPSRSARIAKVRQALNYAANTHVSAKNVCANGKQWVHGWQSGFWTGHMGLACLVAQAELPTATIQAVQRVVADEADYRAGFAPESGYVGDTKAEENAWNSHALALAAAWLNTHSNAGPWLIAAKKFLVNTHTVADTNGDPLASWVTTTTHYPDFSLENHGFYHPGYKAASGELVGDSWLMAKLANPPIAAELELFAAHNVLAAWTNYSYALLDSGEMAFAAGEDWDLNDYEQNAYLAWLAAHFNQPTARWAEARVAALMRYRQRLNGNGQFVGPASSLGFVREAVMAYRTALAWLQWANADHPTGPSTPVGPGFIYMPGVGIIEQRGTNGFFSISYGSRFEAKSRRIMAVIEAPLTSFPNEVYTVTPRLAGVIGQGAMGNPTEARLLRLATNGNAFTAELLLTHGRNDMTDVYVDCAEGAIAMVEVPRPVRDLARSAAGSFTVGIQNAPLNGGSRLLEWHNGSAVMINLSGATRSVTNDWICVAGHYGLVCGPGGYFKYQTATRYGHGTAEDTLQFVPSNSMAPRYAVWLPGSSAAKTLAVASRVTWADFGSNRVLRFPASAGQTRQIVVPRAAGQPTEP